MTHPRDRNGGGKGWVAFVFRMGIAGLAAPALGFPGAFMVKGRAVHPFCLVPPTDGARPFSIDVGACMEALDETILEKPSLTAGTDPEAPQPKEPLSVVTSSYVLKAELASDPELASAPPTSAARYPRYTKAQVMGAYGPLVMIHLTAFDVRGTGRFTYLMVCLRQGPLLYVTPLAWGDGDQGGLGEGSTSVDPDGTLHYRQRATPRALYHLWLHRCTPDNQGPLPEGEWAPTMLSYRAEVAYRLSPRQGYQTGPDMTGVWFYKNALPAKGSLFPPAHPPYTLGDSLDQILFEESLNHASSPPGRTSGEEAEFEPFFVSVDEWSALMHRAIALWKASRLE